MTPRGWTDTLGRCAILALAAAACAACGSLSLPPYAEGIENVDAAGRLPGAIAVGKFQLAPGSGGLNHLQDRAYTVSSPVNDSFADYIAGAAAADLKAAGKLDPSSPRVLSGVVQKNDMAASDVETNSAEVAIHFTLQEGGKTRYDKTLDVRHEWESSFMGSLAIPRALQNYVVTVQKVLRKLYEDADFAKATGK